MTIEHLAAQDCAPMTDAMIEAVARAIYLASVNHPDADWNAVDPRYQKGVWGKRATAAIAALRAHMVPVGWQPIETAPEGADILVYFDHAADTYQDPQEPNKLTAYAAWAESGDYLSGSGMCIAKWHPRHFESEDEYGTGYWLPAAWFAKECDDYERVCNATRWQPLPAPPAFGEPK